MKKKFLLSNLLVLFLFSAAFAQKENKISEPKRIAFYNSYQFGDKKNGIERYTKALEQLGLICIFEDDEAKRKAAYEKEYERRTKFLVEPVKNEINGLLKQIKTQNNTTLLEIVELENNGQLVTFDLKRDISETLITIVNEYFKTKAKPNFALSLPAHKLGKINTELLFDEKTGIKRIASKIGALRNMLIKENGQNPKFEEIKARLLKENPEIKLTEIGEEMQAFALEKGFTAVFDSSQKLPAELEDFQVDDITNDFISYYNQLNP